MKKRGVDMHKVNVIQAGKDVMKKVWEKSAPVFNPNEDNDLRKWKREVMHGKGGPG